MLRFAKDTIIDGAALAASITSAAVDVTSGVTIAFVAVISGTGITTGVLQLQGSPDGVTWANEGSSVSVGATGGTYTMKLADIPWEFMRVTYTQAGGTGTITLKFSRKGLG